MSAREQQQAQPPPAAPPEAGELDAGNRYEAVVPHWFYCKVTDSRERWVPFSTQDSERLEEAHGSGRVRTPWGGGCPPPADGTPSTSTGGTGDFTALLAFSSHRS